VTLKELGRAKKRSVAKQTIDRAKKLTIGEVKNLEDGGELPTTGILGMNFMRDAIKRRREDANKEAKGVLKELEGMDQRLKGPKDDYDSEGDGASAGEQEASAPDTTASVMQPSKAKKTFTAEELALASEQVDQMLENEGEFLEAGVSGPLTVHSVAAANVRAATGTSAASASSGVGTRKKKPLASKPAAPAVAAVENPWLDVGATKVDSGTAGTDNFDGSAASVAALYSSGIDKVDPLYVSHSKPTKIAQTSEKDDNKKNKKERKNDRKAAKLRAPDEPEGLAELRAEADTDDVLNVLNADTEAAREQRDLVRTAFVEGTQEDDFEEEQEKLALDKDELEKKKTTELAGWGHWTGDSMPARKPKGKGKGKGPEPKIAESQKPRPPARVQVLTGKDELNATKASAKYFVDKVPHPFQNPAQYDQQLRMPSGPEWNTLPQHLEKIKPKMFVKVGAIVPPLQYVKHLPPEKREAAIDVWASGKQPKRLKARF